MVHRTRFLLTRSAVAAALVGLVGMLSVLAAPGPVAASCAGPLLEPLGSATPGGVLTVSGLGFGTACYDTGPPPEGVGALGPPIDDIELVVVQDGNEVVVAHGAADADYEFTVEVAVPARLSAGTAEVVARWDAAGGGSVEQPVEIRTDEAAGEPPATTPVATFGPDGSAGEGEPGSPASPERAADPEPVPEDGPNLLVRGAATLVVVGAVAILVLAYRRRAAGPSDR